MLTKNLILSDFHIPDHNRKALGIVLDFISHYRPDIIHLLGDFVNFSKISKYEQDPSYHIELSDEIEVGQDILNTLVKKSRCKVLWYEGNHENRLLRYLARNAAQLAELNIGGEKVVSIPHLFELSKLNVPYIEMKQNHGVLYEHGEVIRMKGGYSAHANLERKGVSSVTGHTHRAALVFKNLYDRTIFGMETGCLCNPKPTPFYGPKIRDWQMAFGTVTVINGKPHPQLYPIINNQIHE